jgi:2-keto-3-deoxy-L-rhamnonate aldolase RhmA
MTEQNLKQRIAGDGRLVGTFVKTPSPIIIEVLGATSLDFIVLDAEHAPFGRLEIDSCLHAARAMGMASLVRVETSEPHHLLQALDSGADGVLVPHVRSAQAARSIVEAAHYRAGGRGFAGSTRAAGYTTVPFSEHLAASAQRTVVIGQIEDLEAVDEINEIAAVPGLDGLFVGPVDLAVSMGAESPASPEVLAMVERIAAAVSKAGVPLGIFVANTADIVRYELLGFSFFVAQSDHVFLRNGANALKA